MAKDDERFAPWADAAPGTPLRDAACWLSGFGRTPLESASLFPGSLVKAIGGVASSARPVRAKALLEVMERDGGDTVRVDLETEAGTVTAGFLPGVLEARWVRFLKSLSAAKVACWASVWGDPVTGFRVELLVPSPPQVVTHRGELPQI